MSFLALKVPLQRKYDSCITDVAHYFWAIVYFVAVDSFQASVYQTINRTRKAYYLCNLLCQRVRSCNQAKVLRRGYCSLEICKFQTRKAIQKLAQTHALSHSISAF